MTRQTRNPLIIATICFLFTGGVLWFAHWQVSIIGTELQSAINRVARNDTLIKQKVEIEELIHTSAAQREQLAAFILTRDETISFLNEIERIAKEQGLSFSTSQLDTTASTDPLFENLRVSFAFSGPEQVVRRLIAIFETLPYNVRVTSLTLSSANEVWQGAISIEMPLLTP